MTKHFIKTLLLFIGMIFIGLLGVFLLSYFDEKGANENVSNVINIKQ